MTITAMRPVPVAVSECGDRLFVEVATDEGLVGTGEASFHNGEAVLRARPGIGHRLAADAVDGRRR